jgi:hypothetical protein
VVIAIENAKYMLPKYLAKESSWHCGVFIGDIINSLAPLTAARVKVIKTDKKTLFAKDCRAFIHGIWSQISFEYIAPISTIKKSAK